MSPGTVDGVWREREATPAAIEENLRRLLKEAHAQNAGYVPARVMNLVCVVDHAWSGEIANRLAKVGRHHPSRTVVCAVEEGRTTLDAVASVAGPADTRAGDFAVLRETVIVTCGPSHLAHLDTIVDPLVVTDLPTMVWAPHGHTEAVDALRAMTQVVLLDSGSEPDVDEALRRASELAGELYVVDLAWLRSVPWRERIAATFDPAAVRTDLRLLSLLGVRHHPDSAASALLLVGWMASRLDWQVGPLLTGGGGPGTRRTGRAHTKRQDVTITLQADPAMTVPGLAGVELESASGRALRFDRGEGGLRVHYRRTGRGHPVQRTWTILGASRGEAGILGEGIRQALLRDPTYKPALEAARVLAGRG